MEGTPKPTLCTPLPQPLPDGILPWTRSCFVCGEANPHGLRLRSRHESGQVVLRYRPRESDRGWRELIHGGIGTTLLDEVMTWAAILRSQRACVAAELNVRLLRPIQVGQELRVIGEVESGSARLVRARGRIVDATGTTLFSAEGKFVPMRAELAALCAADFADCPEAIPVARIFAPA